MLSGTILAEVITQPIPSSLCNLLVVAFINVSGDWKWNIFAQFLPDSICAEIHSMPKPQVILEADVPVWHHTSDGSFSTNSAYHFLMKDHFAAQQNIWKEVWRWPGPQKIRSFLWLVLNDGIKTNVFRFRRGISNNTDCPRCGAEAETLTHMLRDCRNVKSLWQSIVIPSAWTTFFSSNI